MIIVFLFLLNLFALFLFDWDKTQAARQGWRVSERNLLFLALCGGWPALKLGQRWFRHKTRKQPFKSRLNLMIALNLVAVAAIGYVAGPELRAQAFGWPETSLSTLLRESHPQRPKVGFGQDRPSQGTHRFFQPARN
ncbi:DUF1294 domain-containing protein [Antarcticimicrobium sediminis]|uniref:DUF1294 domain-containing protein n=1 Tax=Antarcticimicrobium sediminis TaxID=2546227 RepID=A0A4R5EPR0_9RHOB|nr:DUF1294 domain-containing protein [Antarcticimicrobium sediminis]TDE36644.1 DUF1294 domain-containing protein [Antarcticimicrobium sediminis]